MMMLALHLMVARQFMILVIYLATVSLLGLGSFVSFPLTCTKLSLMVLDDYCLFWINISSLVVD